MYSVQRFSVLGWVVKKLLKFAFKPSLNGASQKPKNQIRWLKYLNISLYSYSLQQTTWHLSTKYQNGKIAEEVRLSTVLLSYVKRKSWDRLFRSGGSHFIYCSQLWASSLPENLCCCLDLDLLQHNRRILRFLFPTLFFVSHGFVRNKKKNLSLWWDVVLFILRN